MKRILLPTDFSKNSLNAIDYALALFERQPCEFFFLNIQKPSHFVTDDLIAGAPSTSIYEAIANDNKKQLEGLKESFVERYRDQPFEFETRFDFDSLEDAIQQLVNEESIELVIMGTNGATDAEEVLFGSNTLRVIRNVRCPILAVPEGYRFNGLSSLLFTLTEEGEFHPDALQPLEGLLRDHIVTLEVLQLNTQRELPKSALLERFAGINYHPLEDIPTEYAVNSYEQLFPVDMHAIFIQPKGFFARIFSGSENTKITYQTRVPLLVLK